LDAHIHVITVGLLPIELTTRILLWHFQKRWWQIHTKKKNSNDWQWT